MALSKSTRDLETNQSDEIPEIFCEHCDNDGKYAEAEGFCIDCNDFMCAVCMKYHSKYKSDHVTQNKQDMPQDYCFEKCSIHQDKCLKFYCTDCTKFACSKCVSVKANPHEYSCVSKTWSSIYTVVQNTDDELYTSIECEVNTIKSDIKKMEDTLASTEKAWQKYNKQIRESVKLHRNEIERKINDFERQLLKTLDERKDTYRVSLDSLRKDIAATKLHIKSAESPSNRIQEANNSVLKFIAMKDCEKRIHSIQYDFCKFQDKLSYTEYDFVAGDSLKIEKHDFGCFIPIQKRTATHKYDLDVDVYFGFIWDGNVSCMCVHNGFLIAVVPDCETIVLFDLMLKIIVSKFKTPSFLGEATSVSENRIAVTLPKHGKLLLLCISDSLTLKQKSEMKVGKGCYGIAYSKTQDCFYVSFTEPESKVIILKETGEMLGLLNKDLLENTLFFSPGNLALSMDERSLYVSDYKRNVVIKIRLDGKVEAVYKDKDLKGPRGIALDEDGSVYVCGINSNNIHQLSSNLSKIGIIVDSADLSCPTSVAICKIGPSEFLYVGMFFNNEIKVFALS